MRHATAVSPSAVDPAAIPPIAFELSADVVDGDDKPLKSTVLVSGIELNV